MAMAATTAIAATTAAASLRAARLLLSERTGYYDNDRSTMTTVRYYDDGDAYTPAARRQRRPGLLRQRAGLLQQGTPAGRLTTAIRRESRIQLRSGLHDHDRYIDYRRSTAETQRHQRAAIATLRQQISGGNYRNNGNRYRQYTGHEG
jgi:hypothetical protein